MCLTDFIDWRYIYSWMVFSTQELYLCSVLPLYFLSDLSPPPPLPKLNIQYIQTVCGCGGVLSCVVDHILQVFYTLFLNRFRTSELTELLHHPKQKDQ